MSTSGKSSPYGSPVSGRGDDGPVQRGVKFAPFTCRHNGASSKPEWLKQPANHHGVCREHFAQKRHLRKAGGIAGSTLHRPCFRFLAGIGQHRRCQYILCFSVSDPAHPIERKIKFLGDGQIKSDDATIDAALNNVLNLNWSRLVNNRKAVLDAFKQRLGKGTLNAAQELKKWDGTQTGDLPEFAQVMVFWLEKRMSRATK